MRTLLRLAPAAAVLGILACSPAAGHATITTAPHHALTDSYGWPQHGVTQTPSNCLAAASVTFLEVYGLHVSQRQFAQQNPGDDVGHAGVLINDYLRPLHVRVITAGAMDAAQLRLLLEAVAGRPVLATVWTQGLPWWKGYAVQGAHEIMIVRLTATGALVWDPHRGWHTAPVGVIAADAWEYLVP